MITKLTVSTEKLTEKCASARFSVFPPRLYYGHKSPLQNHWSENADDTI